MRRFARAAALYALAALALCAGPAAHAQTQLTGVVTDANGHQVNLIPTTQIPLNVPSIVRSGQITAGGVWQQISPMNNNRHRFFFQNPCSATSQGISTAETIYFAAGTAAPSSTFGTLELLPCASYESGTSVVSSLPVWVYAPTSGHWFTATEW